MQQLVEHPWISVHMKQPVARPTDRIRLINRTDSYTDARNFGHGMQETVMSPGGTQKPQASALNEPEEALRPMQVRAA